MTGDRVSVVSGRRGRDGAAGRLRLGHDRRCQQPGCGRGASADEETGGREGIVGPGPDVDLSLQALLGDEEEGADGDGNRCQRCFPLLSSIRILLLASNAPLPIHTPAVKPGPAGLVIPEGSLDKKTDPSDPYQLLRCCYIQR